jgi:ribosome maturation factor RimP
VSNQKQDIETRAKGVAEPLVAAEGAELVDLEFVHEHEGWILRIYIDKQGGVGLEDCSRVSKALDTAFDVEDFIPHEYHLEVSSPGLNRPLTRPDHFQKVVGKKIKLKTYGPIGPQPGRKNFSGVLKGASDEAVTVEVEGAGAFTIPIKDIAKANLEFEF